MPIRITPLVNGQFYHVFNRGVARQPISFRKFDSRYFTTAFSYYRHQNLPFQLAKFWRTSVQERRSIIESLEKSNQKLVTVISYVIMPNHFHLLLRQEVDGGISEYMSLITNSYTRFINTKYNRVGSLFQGAFKAKLIETDEQMIHLSRYIHLNPYTSFVVKDKQQLWIYPWSSLPVYINDTPSWIATTEIFTFFRAREAYKNFIEDQADYNRQMQLIKYLCFEEM
ncbi:transposase [Candidatus Gottesmanbacteria bacterium]|nr:transposase [Candidatus Gottesmanbacteria bacterium]